MAAIDQLKGIMDIVSLTQGKKGGTQTTTHSGGTTTQQTQLSDEAVNEQIKRILAGAGGVRDIGNSARRAGLYNSTTEELLLGNLYATAAAQGEIARAPVVTTSSPTTQVAKMADQEGMGLGNVLLPLVGMAALSKGIDWLTSSGNNSSGILGGAAGGLADTAARGKKAAVNDPFLGGADFNFGLDPKNFSLGASLGSGGWSGDVFGTGLTLGQYGGGNVQGSTAGPYSPKGQADNDLMSLVTSGISGIFGGGLGGLLGSVSSGLGFGGGSSSGGGSSGSVICTALQEIGELDKDLYAKGSEYLAKLDTTTVLGYQIWAVAVADKIRRGNKLALWICRPLARSRTALLATRGSFLDHLRYPLGTLTKFVGEPACKMIGRYLILRGLKRALVV